MTRSNQGSYHEIRYPESSYHNDGGRGDEPSYRSRRDEYDDDDSDGSDNEGKERPGCMWKVKNSTLTHIELVTILMAFLLLVSNCVLFFQLRTTVPDTKSFGFTFKQGFPPSRTGFMRPNIKAYLFYLLAPIVIMVVSALNNWRYNESYTVQGKKRWFRLVFGYGVWGTLLFVYGYCMLVDAFSEDFDEDVTPSYCMTYLPEDFSIERTATELFSTMSTTLILIQIVLVETSHLGLIVGWVWLNPFIWSSSRRRSEERRKRHFHNMQQKMDNYDIEGRGGGGGGGGGGGHGGHHFDRARRRYERFEQGYQMGEQAYGLARRGRNVYKSFNQGRKRRRGKRNRRRPKKKGNGGFFRVLFRLLLCCLTKGRKR
ncbi:hypothetical protein B0J11DRAFT_64664 [Dendryphion nanum]|uniref:Uncharacterized protein n=1 Tax=Dendryphion nanum TaxID=256645 RepID=A0A9P9IGX2_9PLEO|nr:hypothetical protein B0J11DRAFT_64664 [Dendryphion nanum]